MRSPRGRERPGPGGRREGGERRLDNRGSLLWGKAVLAERRGSTQPPRQRNREQTPGGGTGLHLGQEPGDSHFFKTVP